LIETKRSYVLSIAPVLAKLTPFPPLSGMIRRMRMTFQERGVDDFQGNT